MWSGCYCSMGAMLRFLRCRGRACTESRAALLRVRFRHCAHVPCACDGKLTHTRSVGCCRSSRARSFAHDARGTQLLSHAAPGVWPWKASVGLQPGMFGSKCIRSFLGHAVRRPPPGARTWRLGCLCTHALTFTSVQAIVYTERFRFFPPPTVSALVGGADITSALRQALALQTDDAFAKVCPL